MAGYSFATKDQATTTPTYPTTRAIARVDRRLPRGVLEPFPKEGIVPSRVTSSLATSIPRLQTIARPTNPASAIDPIVAPCVAARSDPHAPTSSSPSVAGIPGPLGSEIRRCEQHGISNSYGAPWAFLRAANLHPSEEGPEVQRQRVIRKQRGLEQYRKAEQRLPRSYRQHPPR
jgi:hypothetical protein